MRNPNEGLCGQIPNIALRAIASLYIEPVPLIWNREEKEVRGPTLHRVYCVSSVVLLGRDTGLPHLLAPNLLTGGKGADLVIRGDVVLNIFYQLCPSSSGSGGIQDVLCRRARSSLALRQSNGLRTPEPSRSIVASSSISAKHTHTPKKKNIRPTPQLSRIRD